MLNDCADAQAPFLLVFDNYHVITENSINEADAFLLEHASPQPHLLITSRTDPLLPLSRLRARGQLTELRAEDLRFSADETADFLHKVMSLELSRQQKCLH